MSLSYYAFYIEERAKCDWLHQKFEVVPRVPPEMSSSLTDLSLILTQARGLIIFEKLPFDPKDFDLTFWPFSTSH